MMDSADTAAPPALAKSTINSPASLASPASPPGSPLSSDPSGPGPFSAASPFGPAGSPPPVPPPDGSASDQDDRTDQGEAQAANVRSTNSFQHETAPPEWH